MAILPTLHWSGCVASLLLCLVAGAVPTRSLAGETHTTASNLTLDEARIGSHSAVIHTVANRQGITLAMVTPDGRTTRVTIRVDRDRLVAVSRQLFADLSDPTQVGRTEYLEAARQLYDWLVRPLEAELAAQQIETLMFQIDPSLPAIPISVLHDGDRFLVERYSLSLVPSITLVETPYRPLSEARVLVMGASEFVDRPNLPSVDRELRAIADITNADGFFLNQAFTFENFTHLRRQLNPDIVHLATHAEFVPGAPQASYIQFWDGPVTLDRLHQLDLDLELLVLGACETAFGTAAAELGFAGLAHTLGAKSVLASQWRADDAATSALTVEFYRQLRDPSVFTKAEALRRSQLAALEGRLSARGDRDAAVLAHPHFWGTFTLVGSPW